MPYKDPERKRQWEREHRDERNLRRRKAVRLSSSDLSPNAVAVQAPGTRVGFGVVAGISLILILLFAGLRLLDVPKTSEEMQPSSES